MGWIKKRVGGIPSFSDFGSFFEGLRAPWEGYRYMQANPSLWRYATWPVIINLFLTGLFIYLIWKSFGLYGEHIHPFFETSIWMRIAEVAAIVVAIVLCLVFVVIVWLLLSALLCSVFYAKLAEKVEIILGMDPKEIKEVSILYQVVDALRAAATLGAINIALLFLNLLPGIGSAMALVGTFYFDSYTFGYDYFDYPLVLRGLRREEKLLFVRTHRAHAVGLGSVVLFLNFIPIIGAVFLTTSTVGAVLLHRKLQTIKP